MSGGPAKTQCSVFFSYNDWLRANGWVLRILSECRALFAVLRTMECTSEFLPVEDAPHFSGLFCILGFTAAAVQEVNRGTKGLPVPKQE